MALGLLFRAFWICVLFGGSTGFPSIKGYRYPHEADSYNLGDDGDDEARNSDTSDQAEWEDYYGLASGPAYYGYWAPLPPQQPDSSIPSQHLSNAPSAYKVDGPINAYTGDWGQDQSEKAFPLETSLPGGLKFQPELSQQQQAESSGVASTYSEFVPSTGVSSGYDGLPVYSLPNPSSQSSSKGGAPSGAPHAIYEDTYGYNSPVQEPDFSSSSLDLGGQPDFYSPEVENPIGSAKATQLYYEEQEQPSVYYEEQPSLQEEQPSVYYEEQPSVYYEEQPSLQEELPQPSLHVKQPQPSLQEKQPSLQEKQPSLQEKQPSLHVKQPQPSLQEKQPSHHVKQPQPSHHVKQPQPSLQEKQPSHHVKQPQPSLQEKQPSHHEEQPQPSHHMKPPAPPSVTYIIQSTNGHRRGRVAFSRTSYSPVIPEPPILVKDDGHGDAPHTKGN